MSIIDCVIKPPRKTHPLNNKYDPIVHNLLWTICNDLPPDIVGARLAREYMIQCELKRELSHTHNPLPGQVTRDFESREKWVWTGSEWIYIRMLK